MNQLATLGFHYLYHKLNRQIIFNRTKIWVYFKFQMLSGLCNAGSRLSHCLCVLSQENHLMAAHCQAMWEELVRASTVASSNIKSNVLTALQELSLNDVDSEKTRSGLDTNQVGLALTMHLID